MTIVFTANAKKRLRQIFDYYCDKDLPAVALRIRTSIENRILYLEKFPRMGAVEEALRDLGLGHRYLVEGNYKIIYRIAEDMVYITDVFHARQDPSKMKP